MLAPSRRRFLTQTFGFAAASTLPFHSRTARAALATKLPPTTVPIDRSTSAPTAPVSIGRANDYDIKTLAEVLSALFDQTGGLKNLVSGKSVAVKLNTTGDGRRGLGRFPAERSYQVHPAMIEVLCGLFSKAGAKRIWLLESYYRTRTPESILSRQGWDIGRIQSAGDQKVVFEDTRNRGAFTEYAEVNVPWGGYVYPSWHLNRRYVENDVLVTIAKLKNHANAGYTGAVKNLFGMAPTALYGNDAPNEDTTENRGDQLHYGQKSTPEGVPSERYEGWMEIDRAYRSFYRVPRVTSDLFGARPTDLAVIDGIETCKGGEGPWIRGVEPIQPGLVLAGRNAITADAVGCAAMGYDPTARPGEDVWLGDNHLALLAKAGIGTNDPSRIEVRGVKLVDALCEYEPGHEGWVRKHLTES